MTGANTDASPACRSPYVVDRIKPLVIRGGGSIDCGTVKAALLSVDEAQPNGRGVPLMRSFMRELHYLRRGNLNVLTMVLNCAMS